MRKIETLAQSALRYCELPRRPPSAPNACGRIAVRTITILERVRSFIQRKMAARGSAAGLAMALLVSGCASTLRK
jgi:hypothetical protein